MCLGLTLLIPHLLATNKSFLFGAKLKIFTVAHNVGDVEEDKKKYLTNILLLLVSVLYLFIF